MNIDGAFPIWRTVTLAYPYGSQLYHPFGITLPLLSVGELIMMLHLPLLWEWRLFGFVLPFLNGHFSEWVVLGGFVF